MIVRSVPTRKSRVLRYTPVPLQASSVASRASVVAPEGLPEPLREAPVDLDIRETLVAATSNAPDWGAHGRSLSQGAE